MSVLMMFLMVYATGWIVLAWTGGRKTPAAVADMPFGIHASEFDAETMRTAA